MHAGAAVDFDAFQKVLNRPGGFRDPGEPEEYCRGFQVFDKDMTGFIGVGQLRYSTCFLLWRGKGREWRLTRVVGSPDKLGREDERRGGG